MHIAHRVVFQNLECLQRFGLPRPMPSNAELLANTDGELSSERHAAWSLWHAQLLKVSTSMHSACIGGLACLTSDQSCWLAEACNILLPATCVALAEHAQAIMQASNMLCLCMPYQSVK